MLACVQTFDATLKAMIEKKRKAKESKKRAKEMARNKVGASIPLRCNAWQACVARFNFSWLHLLLSP